MGDDEWDDLAQLIYDNWDNYIAISFLPKDKNSYPLMPYEEITEIEYLQRLNELSNVDLTSYLKEFEIYDGQNEVLDISCDTGICPPR